MMTHYQLADGRVRSMAMGDLLSSIRAAECTLVDIINWSQHYGLRSVMIILAPEDYDRLEMHFGGKLVAEFKTTDQERFVFICGHRFVCYHSDMRDAVIDLRSQ